MEIETMFDTAKRTLSETVGIDQTGIELDKTLVDDLEIASFDLVDVLIELESAYDEPFDGVPTKAGIEALKRELPEMNQEKLKEGLTVHASGILVQRQFVEQ